MKILITGGCGFIGSHLVDFHLKKGDQVCVIDDLSTGALQNIRSFYDNANFKLNNDNILNWKDLKKTVAWADCIYHLAAVVGVYRVLKEPLEVLSVNIKGCELLLETIDSLNLKPRVIIASSSSVYGHNEHARLNENNDLILKSTKNPLRNYALSKIANEALGIAYHYSKKIPITIVRLFNTIGPRQTGSYGMVVPRFVQQACDGETIKVYGDGTQTRSFCDVRDVINILSLLITMPNSIGEIINVGNDDEISINDLAHLVKKLANSNSDIQYIPLDEAYGEAFYDIKHRKPDLSKLYQLTHFKHQWTLEQTLNYLIKDFYERKST